VMMAADSSGRLWCRPGQQVMSRPLEKSLSLWAV
jgi:hypothetical protein